MPQLTFIGSDGVEHEVSATWPLPITVAAGGDVTSITGTAGQITASSATGAVTLSIPTAMTGITSLTAPASTDLTLNAGSGNQNTNLIPTGTGFASIKTAAMTSAVLIGAHTTGLTLGVVSLSGSLADASIAGLIYNAGITYLQTIQGNGLIFRRGATEMGRFNGTTSDFTFAGKIASYNGVNTAGWGVGAIQAAGSVVGATAAGNITNGAYTVGAADGEFLVSANLLVTAATAVSTSLNVAYTDESNTARTLILPISGLAGSFLAGGLATSASVFESAVLHIRCKATTTITISVAAGTFTGVTYNARCCIRQIA